MNLFYHNQLLFIALLLFIQLVLFVEDIVSNSVIPGICNVSVNFLSGSETLRKCGIHKVIMDINSDILSSVDVICSVILSVSSREKVPVFSFYNGGKTSLARLYFKNEDFSV